MSSSIDFITTGDGSHSLYNSEIKESYHSTYGAILESKHIFIEAGLNLFKDSIETIHILEVGFGTGLNGLLSYIWSHQFRKSVNYQGIEAYPVNKDVTGELNYPGLLEIEKSIFLELHKTDEIYRQISPYFNLKVNHALIQEFSLPADYFQVVYFDAFSPAVQPEMWSVDVFRSIFKAMRKGGVMTTYSTKGDVKRGLMEVGFLIEKIPGPVGKREVLRAFKK